jgi:hypothetical protein
MTKSIGVRLIGLLNIKIVHCVHYHSSILVGILTKCFTMILYKNNLDALLQNVGVVHWSPSTTTNELTQNPMKSFGIQGHLLL